MNDLEPTPQPAATQPPVSDKGLPWLGIFAIGFGIAGILTWGVVFVPLGFIFSVLALFFGQILFGIVGLILALIGFGTSPMLWAIVGLGWLMAMFGMPGSEGMGGGMGGGM